MHKSKIIYITGGERSGKSSHAERLAKSLSDSPVYIATARISDSDFEKRVEHHQSSRDTTWTTIEENIEIHRLTLTNEVVLLDCITLWLANIYFDNKEDLDLSLEIAKQIWDKFSKQDFRLVVVSNEIGMGVHGHNATIRDFTQLQGWMNQYIAKKADEAWMMVSGIPLRLK